MCSLCGSGADAFFGERGVSYACVAGCAVRGNGRAPRRSLPRYSFSAYSQVCGAGHLVEGAPPHQSPQPRTCAGTRRTAEAVRTDHGAWGQNRSFALVALTTA